MAGSTPWSPKKDPTFDDPNAHGPTAPLPSGGMGGLGKGGMGLSEEDIKKARSGKTVKMGPGGEPYVE